MSYHGTIEVGKLYRSRRNEQVRIYATDGLGRYSIHGATKDPGNGWAVLAWSPQGLAGNGLSGDTIVGEWHELQEPKYRPYSDEQLNACIGKRIIQKDNGRSCLIGFEVGDGLVFVFGANLNVSADNLLEYYTWPNGRPCGVLENQS